MQWRMAMVLANLKVTSSDRWTRSDAYDRLDPSEKVAVSYFLGMVQAELTAVLALGYTHLVHVDALLKEAGMPLGGKRPDFLALSVPSKGPTVFGATVEAKGRTNGFDKTALDKAKRQARMIPTIRGIGKPETVASEAYFNDAEEWSSVLEDPEFASEEMQVGVESYLVAYYRTVIQAGRESATWRQEGDEFAFDVPAFPFAIRLPKALVDGFDLSVRLNRTEREVVRPLLLAYWTLTSDVSVRPDSLVQLVPSDVDAVEVFSAFERDEQSTQVKNATVKEGRIE